MEIPDVANFDAADFFDEIEGPNVLPCDIITQTLHHLASHQSKIVVRDKKSGHEVDHQQLLSDILACRNRIRASLDPESLQALRRDHEVSICIWASGYAFTVAFFAAFALGATVASFSPHITTPEAVYFSRKIRAHAVLVASSHLKGAEEVRNQSGLGPRLKVVEITPCLVSPLIDPRSIILALGRVRDQNKPGVIIFTSGSTGPPKAVAMRRYNVFMTALSAIRNQNITRDSRIIQLLPTHHATGLFVNTLPGILGGGCVEFNQGQFDAAETWEQFRRGDLRNFSGVPTIYTRLLRHWEIVILKMPEQEQESYRHGASKILRFESSTAPLPLNVAKAWLALTGTPIAERYGGSEFGNVYGHYSGVKIVLGSVGVKNPHMESKLSEGDRGEVLVRGPLLFSK